MNAERLHDMVEQMWVRTQCLDLCARYCQGVDHSDQDIFMSIWHPEGKYVVGRRQGVFAGTTELAQALDFVREAYASTHHWTTNHVVTRAGVDVAIGVSDSIAICVDHADRPHFVAATYQDDYVRHDGDWKIRRRVVRRWLVSEQVPVSLRHPETIAEQS